jgi:hypothetical protein
VSRLLEFPIHRRFLNDSFVKYIYFKKEHGLKPIEYTLDHYWQVDGKIVKIRDSIKKAIKDGSIMSYKSKYHFHPKYEKALEGITNDNYKEKVEIGLNLLMEEYEYDI